MRVNIADVAKEAKVSTITASRVFSNPALVTLKTRSRVLKVAEDLGYVPNRLARGLRSGKTHTVAVLTTDIRQRLNTLKLDRLQREIMRQGYHTLLLVQYPGEDSRSQSLLSSCRGTIDGLVLCCLEGAPSLDQIHDLVDMGMPVVSLEPLSGLEIDVVTADREQGSALAVDHLRRLGHTEIALAQIEMDSEVVARRAEGYQQAMEAAGLMPLIVSRRGEGDSVYEDGYCLIHEARANAIRPTAWVFSDDEMAVGAMQAMQECGWRIPEDVAIIGWDDSPLCEYVRPRLTSVTQPVEETARRLIDCLLARMNDAPEAPAVSLIPSELVIRESCGASLAVRRAVF